jgi:hypothetical protein
VIQQLQQLRQQRLKRLNPIVASPQHDYCNGQCRQILLALDVPIRHDEHIKLCGCQRQQLAVLDTRPACA